MLQELLQLLLLVLLKLVHLLRELLLVKNELLLLLVKELLLLLFLLGKELLLLAMIQLLLLEAKLKGRWLGWVHCSVWRGVIRRHWRRRRRGRLLSRGSAVRACERDPSVVCCVVWHTPDHGRASITGLLRLRPLLLPLLPLLVFLLALVNDSQLLGQLLLRLMGEDLFELSLHA